MSREQMWAREQRISRTAAEREAADRAAQNRKRWAGAFVEVDAAALPNDGAVYFATEDAYVDGVGLVKGGSFFKAGTDTTPSRSFLPASREALRRLTALRDELLDAGKEAEAALVDLRPVRPPADHVVEQRAREPRTADEG